METKYLTRNRTYGMYQKIRPRYIVVHSTAAGLTSRMTLFNAWNQEGANVSCHGMVDDKGWMLTLPLDCKGWHVGGKGNDESIGFEVCEPKFIAYVDEWHSVVDTRKYRPNDPKVFADFKKRWNQAVDIAAYLCRETGLGSECVLSHKEMHAIGKATNHGDVQHWFDLFGEQFNMDAFRRAVRQRLNGAPQTVRAMPKTLRRHITQRNLTIK